MAGWIKLHRELSDKPIWLDSTPVQKTILITLLIMANHGEKEWEWRGQKYKAVPGQFVTSLPKIREKCGIGISVQNIRTSLKRFEKYDFLTDESTNVNRLITIVNWGIYQKKDNEVTDELTGNQQATNRQLTANKKERIKELNNKDLKHMSYSDDFEQFWTVYPKQVGKKRAYEKWNQRIKNDTSLNLIQAAENYAKKCEHDNTETKYIKHPSTFLSAKEDYKDFLETNVIQFDDAEERRQRRLAESQRLLDEYDRRAEEARNDPFDPKPLFEQLRRKLRGAGSS